MGWMPWQVRVSGAVAVGLMNWGLAAAASRLLAAADITLEFAAVCLTGQLAVFDNWAQHGVGSFSESFTARAVPIKVPHSFALQRCR